MTHKNIVIVIAADVVYVVYFCIFGPYFEIVFFGKTSIKLFSKCQIFIQFLIQQGSGLLRDIQALYWLKLFEFIYGLKYYLTPDSLKFVMLGIWPNWSSFSSINVNNFSLIKIYFLICFIILLYWLFVFCPYQVELPNSYDIVS